MSRSIKTISAILFGLSTTSGCMATDMAKDLDGTWLLQSIDGKLVEATDKMPYFTISNGIISGYDGCNTFSGPLEDPLQIRMTQKACAGDFISLPLDISNPGEHLATGTVRDGTMSLPARAIHPASTFVREE